MLQVGTTWDMLAAVPAAAQLHGTASLLLLALVAKSQATVQTPRDLCTVPGTFLNVHSLWNTELNNYILLAVA